MRATPPAQPNKRSPFLPEASPSPRPQFPKHSLDLLDTTSALNESLTAAAAHAASLAAHGSMVCIADEGIVWKSAIRERCSQLSPVSSLAAGASLTSPLSPMRSAASHAASPSASPKVSVAEAKDNGGWPARNVSPGPDGIAPGPLPTLAASASRSPGGDALIPCAMPVDLFSLKTVAASFKNDVQLKKVDVTRCAGVVPPPSFTSVALFPAPPQSPHTLAPDGSASPRPSTSGRRVVGDKQVVTTIMVSRRFPQELSRSLLSHLVAYEKQGNTDFYTPEMLEQRQSLKSHFLVLERLEHLWSVLPKTVPSMKFINYDIFKWLHAKIYATFAADPSPQLGAQIASEDWRVDSKDKLYMDAAEFQRFMSNVADIWCQTLDVDEYCDFIDACSNIITATGLPYTGPCDDPQSTSAGAQRRGTTRLIAALKSRVALGKTVAALSLRQAQGQTTPAEAGAAEDDPKSPQASGRTPCSDDDGRPVPPATPPPTKEEQAATSRIRTLQAAAAVEQSTKVVHAYVASGIAEVDTTETRQLQGLFRLVCELEEQEEDELLRLVRWTREFVDDFIATRESELPATSSGAEGAAAAALRESIVMLVKALSSIETDMLEFSDSEAADRRRVVALVTDALEVLSKSDRQQLSVKLTELRQRISAHWKTAIAEKGKLREGLTTAIATVGGVYKSFYSALRQRQGITALDEYVARVVDNELDELKRCSNVAHASARDHTTVIEFVTKELAAQKPITTLLEATLLRAKSAEASGGGEVEVGSAEWDTQIKAIAKVSIGLYNVADALHQEMQKSLAAILLNCEESTQVLYDEARLRSLCESAGCAGPAMAEVHLRIGAERARALSDLTAERESVSTIVSDLRLTLNWYFTKVCRDETQLLCASTTIEQVHAALAPRLEFFSNPKNVVGEGQSSTLHSSGMLELWFTVISDKKRGASTDAVERTFCAAPFFPFVQHANVEWTCKLLSEITRTLSNCVLTLLRFQREHEVLLSKLLQEVERHAAECIKKQSWTLYPTAADVSRSRAERQCINFDVETANAELIHATLNQLIGVPQKALSDKSTYFMKKAVEWRGKKRVIETMASTLAKSQSAFGSSALRGQRRGGVNILNDLERNANEELLRANQEIDSFLTVEAQRQDLIEALRLEELDHLSWMNARKEVADKASIVNRSFSPSRSSSIKRTTSMIADARRASTEQHRVASMMKLKRVAKAATVLRQSSLRYFSDDVPAVDSSNDADNLSRTASGVGSLGRTKSGIFRDGKEAAAARQRDVVVSAHVGDTAYEKRKAAYIRNRCSNADIFVGECIKSGCGVLDSIRTQLSSTPRIYNATIFPFAGVSFNSASVVDLLGDLCFLNPLQQLVLCQCNLADNDAAALCRHLSGHPTLMFIDIRQNQKITTVKSLLQLLDATPSLNFFAASGCGLADKDVAELTRTCQERRKEKRTLSAAEREMLAGHFDALKDKSSGLVSLDSLEAAKQFAASPLYKCARGSNHCVAAAVQSVVYVFASLSLKRLERWTATDMLRKMFPDLLLEEISATPAALEPS